MLDLSHMPGGYAGAAGQAIFYGDMPAVGGLHQTWVKPRGIVMVHVFMLGQGGNGAAGTVGATATGGAGGGSGAQSELLIPAAFLPDVCFVGAGAGGNGVAAVNSYFAARPSTSNGALAPPAAETFLIAGGALGLSAAVGATGTPATALLSGRGIASFTAGMSGGNGGTTAGTGGSSPTNATTGLVVTGGGGGGGMSGTLAGTGGIPSWVFTPPINLTPTPAGTSGVAGGNGVPGLAYMDWRFLFNGGSGGGAGFPLATQSNAGNGGNGAYGCGGGGGGGAFTGFTAGTGGKGGAGLVVITYW